MYLRNLPSLQIPEKREASDRERPFCDTASRECPSHPSERQKLSLSTTITTNTDIFQLATKIQANSTTSSTNKVLAVMQLGTPDLGQKRFSAENWAKHKVNVTENDLTSWKLTRIMPKLCLARQTLSKPLKSVMCSLPWQKGQCNQ